MDLEISTIVVGPFQQNCRVVKDRATGEAVVVDPGAEADRILKAVAQSAATVRYILLTHAHLDHCGAAAPVQRALGAPLAMHSGDLPLLRALPEHGAMFGLHGLEVPTVDIDLAATAALPFADGEIEVVHTPGHTPGGVTFLFGRHGFFGDTLFQMSVGRTDLGGNAKTYAQTLREKVLTMPDDTVVYTGHGPDTTIGQERVNNPFLNGQIRIDDPGQAFTG